jgi:hypothetical protein
MMLAWELVSGFEPLTCCSQDGHPNLGSPRDAISVPAGPIIHICAARAMGLGAEPAAVEFGTDPGHLGNDLFDEALPAEVGIVTRRTSVPSANWPATDKGTALAAVTEE